MLIEIRGRALPGRRIDGHGNLHVGVQRRREVTETWPGDAPRVRWEVVATVTGDGDLRGPHVQGRRGDRVVYLRWVDLADDGTPTLLRRVGLRLAAAPAEVLAAAARPGWRLVGDLDLTDDKGRPVTGSVRPPAIAWSAAWPA